MRPPIFDAVDVPAVRSLLGTDPVRFFSFGQAPASPGRPYAVWQTLYGSPENQLSGAPLEDRWGIQVDVYATSPASVLAVAEVLRDALEPACHIVRWGGESIDQPTGLNRYSFDVEFITRR